MNNKKKKLQKELKKLLDRRMKTKDKGWVMDSYGYEDELKEQINNLK